MVTLLCTVRDCRSPLRHEGRRMVCERGHSFDIARSGYVNLLQPQDRRSKKPGDSAEAVVARRRFLQRGLADPLVEQIIGMLPLDATDALLDVGCGEGHHLAAFRSRYGCEAHGTDISIPAIDAASRLLSDCAFVVANADRFLPYAPGSFAAVLSVTARLNPAEFRRILAAGGRLLVAIPGADDLVELREAVLGERVERDRVDRTLRMFAEDFTLQRQERAAYVAHLDRAAIADVTTSSYRGLRHRERERLAAIDALDVTLSRDVLLFR